jgi:ABC-type lipoprotein release transport system permease subunit
MLFFTMAWRNVWRNRRRSTLTVLAIALGLAFNIFMRGIGDGFHDQMVDNSVRAEIGHIQIHRLGYRNDPGLNETLPDPKKVTQVIRSLPGLRGYSLRVLGSGLASTSENSSGVQILGVVPAQEQTVTSIQNAIVRGRYLAAGVQRPILVGDRLATHLKVSLDDKVVLLVQAADGSMGAQLFRVAGIFGSGSPEMDEGIVFILRSDAQTLFSLGNRVTEAALLLASSRQVPADLETLKADLTGEPVEILPWWQIAPFLQQFIQIDDAFFYIIVLIFFIVISIGILNTIMMSIFERVREFGVMMALGTKPRQIIQLVVQEALTLGLVGIAAGSVIGSALTQYFARHGINLSSFSAGAAALGITSSRVYSELTTANLLYSNLAVFVVVLLVALYPAVHAAGLKPVEAIRHV